MHLIVKLLHLLLILSFSTLISAQCSQLLTELSTPDCEFGCNICLGDQINFVLTGDNMQDGGCIDWYIGPDGTGDLTGETYIGCSDITADCPDGPQYMYMNIDPPPGPDRCDEFVVIYTGGSSFNADDIEIINGFGNPLFTPYAVGNIGQFFPDCGLIPVGPGDNIPDDAILILQSSLIATNTYDISELCALSLDIYVLGSSNTDCGGGYLVNNADNSYTIELGCVSEVVNISAGANAWSFLDGVGNWVTEVPPMAIPDPSPGVTTIDDFLFEMTQSIIDDYCVPPSVQLDIQGYLNPQDGGGCTDVVTATYNLTLSCPNATDINDIVACDSGGAPTVDLTMYDNDISGGIGTVVWYNNSNGTGMISDPSNYTGTGPVYAAVQLNGCESEPIEILFDVFPAPMIDVFSDPDPACAGENITLFEDGGDAVDWSWSGPNGFTSDDQNPSVNNAEAGTYSVTITDANGCLLDADYIYDPMPSPHAEVDVSVTDLCEGGCLEVVFTVTDGGGGPYDVVWEIAGLISIPFVANNDMEVWTICTTPGLFPIIDFGDMTALVPDFLTSLTMELISISEDGCDGTVDADVIELIIIEPPVANDAGPLEACLEVGVDDAEFDLESLDSDIGNGEDVEWYEDMDLMDEISPPYFTDVSTTVYAVVFDGDCYSEPVAIDLIILSVGGAGEDGSLTFCQGEANAQDLFAALTGTPDMGGTWMDIDGAGVDLSDPTSVDFSGISDGTYNFSYNFDAVAGCPASSANIEVTIDPQPQLFIGDDGCTADNMFYELEFTTDIVSNVFSDIGVVTNIMGNMYVVSVPADESSFTIMLTDPNTGCMYTETFVIPDCDCGFIPNPEIDPMIYVCEGDTYPILDPNAPSGLDVNWFDNLGVLIQTSNTFQAAAPGNYSVQFIDPLDVNCVSDVLTFVIVEQLIPNIGMNASVEMCFANNTTFNLIDLLGNPDAGGVWLDPMMTGIDLSDPTMMNFSLLPIGDYNYEYLIASEGCGDQVAQFMLSVIDSPNAGSDKDTLFCTGEITVVDLGNIISPFDAGGIWTESTSLIDLSMPNAVDLTNVAIGDYMINYTIPATDFCQAQMATINLSIVDKPYAGDDVMTNVCIGSDIDLADLLISNNAVGTFESLDMSISLNMSVFETAGIAIGSFDFYHIIEETDACEADTALITVVLNNSLTAGSDNQVDVCAEPGIQLADFILNADLGGVFTDLSNGMVVSSGIFDATGLAGQMIDFDYQVGGGTCPIDNATLTLNVIELAEISFSIDSEQICEGSCSDLTITITGPDVDLINYSILDESNTTVLSDQLSINGLPTNTVQICSDPTNGTLSLSNMLSDQNYTIEFNSFQSNACTYPLDESIDIISFTPEPVLVDDEICSNMSIEIDGMIFDATNPTGTVIVSGTMMCDSIITVDLTILEVGVGVFDDVVCGSAIININGTDYSSSNSTGIETVLGGATNGCDSVITVDLQFESEVMIDVNESLCEGDFIELGNEVFDVNNSSGQVTVPSSTTFGCDTIYTVMLDFDGSFSFDVITPCPSETTTSVIIDGLVSDLLPAILTIDGAQTQTINNLPFTVEDLAFGTYDFEVVAANGCISMQELTVENNGDAQFQIIQFSTGENTYQLGANSNLSIDSISWSNGAQLTCDDCLMPNTTPIIGEQTFVATGFYGEGCSISDSITISEVITDCIFIANVFSPDGDGVNDELYVQTCKESTILNFEIYDRWGNLMWSRQNYSSADIGESWNGRTSDGQRALPGVYVYLVQVDLPIVGEQISTGSVTILR